MMKWFADFLWWLFGPRDSTDHAGPGESDDNLDAR